MDAQTLTLIKALADDTRLQILQHLCCVWLTVNDVVERLDGKINQPTVSHHLKKLEEADLVLMQQDGKYRYYTLNQERVAFCCGALVSEFMPGYRLQIVRTSEAQQIDVRDIGVRDS